jgi:hypothetical protein
VPRRRVLDEGFIPYSPETFRELVDEVLSPEPSDVVERAREAYQEAKKDREEE